MKKRVWVYLFVLLSSNPFFISLFAQPAPVSVHVTKWADNEGYALEGDPSDIVQDSLGYMWIGTHKGLYRFDGVLFTLFPLAVFDAAITSSPKVLPLCIDRNCILVAVEGAGLFWFDVKTHQTKALTVNHRYKALLSRAKITSAIVGPNHTLWVTTLFEGVWKIDNNTLKVHFFNSDATYNKLWVSSSSISNLAPYHQKGAYAATNDGLFYLDFSTGKSTAIPIPFALPKGLKFTIAKVLIYYNKLYICTWGSGVVVYDLTSKTWSQLLWNKLERTGAKNIALNCIPVRNQLWIATLDQGLFQLQNDTVLIPIIGYGQSITYENTLFFHGMYYNNQNQTLYGTWDKSIYGLQPSPNYLSYYSNPFKENAFNHLSFLNNKGLLAWGQDSQLWYWFGERQMPKQLQKPVGMKPILFTMPFYNSAPGVMVVTVDGWWHFNASDLSFKPFNITDNTWNKALKSNWVVGTDTAGNLWLADNQDQLLHYNAATNKVTTYALHQLYGALPNLKAVIRLWPQTDGSVWISSQNGYGLVHFNPTKKSAVNWGKCFSYLNNNPLDLAFLSKDEIVVCLLNRGIGYLNFGAPKPVFKSFTSARNNLLTDRYSHAQADTGGWVWLSSSKGLTLLNVFSQTIKNFDEKNGMPAFEPHIKPITIQNNALALVQKNNIMVVNRIQALKITTNFTANPVFQSFTVNGNATAIDPNYLQTIDLKQGQTLAFQCGALGASTAEKPYFRYQLKGYDSHWNYASANDQILYPQLKGGNFTLQIQILNEQGQPSQATRNLSVSVIPPVWQRTWFQWLMLVVLFSSVTALIVFRLKKVKAQHILQLQITESELKALKAQMNPHFIFNAMNTLEALISLEQTENANAFVHKFSRLMRLVLENSQYKLVALEKDLEALQQYIWLEQRRFKTPFNVTITGIDSADMLQLRIPPLVIQPFVENAIVHGLKPLEDRQGHITIAFSVADSILTVSITDNGVGRKPHAKSKHLALGSSVTAKRLELLNLQKIKIEPVLYKDLFSIQGDPIGTAVILKIKL